MGAMQMLRGQEQAASLAASMPLSGEGDRADRRGDREEDG